MWAITTQAMAVPTSTSVCVNIPIYTKDEVGYLVPTYYSILLTGRITKLEWDEECHNLIQLYKSVRQPRIQVSSGCCGIGKSVDHDRLVAGRKAVVFLEFLKDLNRKYAGRWIQFRYRNMRIHDGPDVEWVAVEMGPQPPVDLLGLGHIP